MRTLLLILILLFSFNTSFAQNKQIISVQLGKANNLMIRNTNLVGSGSVEGKGSILFGVDYQTYKKARLSYQIGLDFSKNNFELTPAFQPDIDMSPHKKEVKIIGLHFLANFTFLKYAFVNGGVLLDYDMSPEDYSGIDNQSGLGISAGIGGKYQFSDFEISINPFVNSHSIIPFKESNYQQHLWQAGIKFGVGYVF